MTELFKPINRHLNGLNIVVTIKHKKRAIQPLNSFIYINLYVHDIHFVSVAIRIN